MGDREWAACLLTGIKAAAAMLKPILTGLIVAVAMVSGAVAELLEDGQAASDRGHYATALKIIP